MCYFFGGNLTAISQIKIDDLALNLNQHPDLSSLLTPVVDGFRYPDTPIIYDSGKDFVIAKAHWEFIPPWIKNTEELANARKKGIPWLNASSEKLFESKMFKPAALKRRCLVMASWFFEWRHIKLNGEKKSIAYPYAIGVKDAPYFFFAGIWQPWTDKCSGETMDTFAIITTRANAIMEQIHNTKMRMPVILTQELARHWLDSRLIESEIAEIASFQFPSSSLWYHPVEKDFKMKDFPIESFQYPDLPALLPV